MFSKTFEINDTHLLFTCGRQRDFTLFEFVVMDNRGMDSWAILDIALCGFFAHIVWMPY